MDESDDFGVLDSASMQRIRREEEFRLAVRHQLEGPNRTLGRGTLIDFLNSGLGLFILSTIFVSTFSWAYKSIGNAYAEHNKRTAVIQHLSLEILNRRSEIERLRGRFHAENLSTVRSALFGVRPGETVNPSWKRFYSPMFNEYGIRSITSLLWELEVTCSPPTRDQVKTLRLEIASLGDCLDNIKYSTERGGPETQDGAAIEFCVLPLGDRQMVERLLPKFGVLEHLITRH